MKRFSNAKVTTTTIAMTAVAVIATAAVAGATMTTTALASSTAVHHSARDAKNTKDAKTTKHEGGTTKATKATAATKATKATAATKATKVTAATKVATAAAARVVSESQDASGTYMTVVKCSGKTVPAPVVITTSDPFTVKGTIDTKVVTKALAQKPSGYTPVYTCTVTVLKKLPACSTGKSVVKGLTGHGTCMSPQQELAWFVSQAVSSSGPKSKACLTARKLAGKGDKTAHKAERFACAGKLVLNTGFGGAAGSVSHHHPRK